MSSARQIAIAKVRELKLAGATDAEAAEAIERMGVARELVSKLMRVAREGLGLRSDGSIVRAGLPVLAREKEQSPADLAQANAAFLRDLQRFERAPTVRHVREGVPVRLSSPVSSGCGSPAALCAGG
ncbi:MAG: hypothetical protein P4L76_17900 [Beijerinckiaceae bacterium]|nr:hypothetical protein [Beijerinckiaceae bacterium]